MTDEEFAAVKNHCINPVDSRETGMEKPETLVAVFDEPADVEILKALWIWQRTVSESFMIPLNLAMTFRDFLHIQKYFREEEKRDPSVTEIRVLTPTGLTIVVTPHFLQSSQK